MTSPNDKVDGSDNMARTGLTKREYFAANAMQGLTAFPGSLNNKNDRSVSELARMAVSMADALIKELNMLPVNVSSNTIDE